jgi:hypothetical protein
MFERTKLTNFKIGGLILQNDKNRRQNSNEAFYYYYFEKYLNFL